MANNLPTASVTGRQEWKWNQWQAEKDPRDGHEPVDRQPRTPDSRRRQRRNTDRETEAFGAEPERRERRLRRVIEELEAKLEQKEQRIQYIIEHYERLLNEKNQQLTAQNDAESDPEIPVLSKVRRYVSVYRPV